MKFTTQKSVLPFKLPMQGKKKLPKATDPFNWSIAWGRYTRERIRTSISFFEWVSMTYINFKKKNRAIQLYNLTEQDKFLFFIWSRQWTTILYTPPKKVFYHLNYFCKEKLLKKMDPFELIHLLKQVYRREDLNLHYFFWIGVHDLHQLQKKNRTIYTTR